MSGGGGPGPGGGGASNGGGMQHGAAAASGSGSGGGGGRVSVPLPEGFQLPPDLVKDYLRDGYCVVPGMLSDEECDRALEEARRVLAGEQQGARPSEVDWKETRGEARPGRSKQVRYTRDLDEEEQEWATRLWQPHNASPHFTELSRHPRLAAVLNEVVGAHLHPDLWEGDVKCIQTMYFYRSLVAEEGTSLHQDEYYIPTRDRSLTAVWIPLVDVDEHNGCLHVVPESHRTGYFYPFNNERRSCTSFDRRKLRAVRMRRGSALIFNGYLIHGSMNKTYDGPRPVFTAHYANAWSIVPWMGKKDMREGMFVVCGRDPYEGKAKPPGTCRVGISPPGHGHAPHPDIKN
eukprot:g6032.t1